MAVIFQVRGTSLTAYYARFAASYGLTGTGTAVALVSDNSAGIFGGSYIDMNSPSVVRGIGYPGFTNTPSGQTFAILMRVIPRYTGNPASNNTYFCWGGITGSLVNSVEISHLTTGKLRLRYTNNAQTAFSVDTTISFAPVSGTPVDLMLSWDGSTTANAIKWSVDGVELETRTAGTALPTADQNLRTHISIGAGPTSAISDFELNELVIFDTAESHTYTARTDFYTATNFEGMASAAQVKTGEVVAYTTGTRTGTYDGSDRYTDPGVSLVLSPTAYKFNSTTNNRTGTLIAPTAADIADAVWDEATSGHTTAGTFGALVQKLLTVAKFLGLK